MEKKLTCLKALFLQAFYDWLKEQKEVIYILINNTKHNDPFFKSYEKDAGVVILNISPEAVLDLKIDDNGVSFGGSFSGFQKNVYLPLEVIIGVHLPKEKDGGMRSMLFPTSLDFNFENETLNIDKPRLPEPVKAANNKGNNNIVDFASRKDKKDGK